MAEQTPRAVDLDLTGLAAEHDVLDPPLLRGRALRRHRLLVLALALLVLAVAAWWGGPEAVPGVAAVLTVVALVRWWTQHPRLCARTRLDPDVLEVKDGGLGRGDRYAWWFVREVTCTPRKQVPGRAVLGDGRRLRLHGMPAADVDRLTSALRRAHGNGPSGGDGG